MKFYSLDKEKTLEINALTDNLYVKQCYNNVYNIFVNNLDKFYNKDYTVCYGIGIINVSENRKLGYRHCFILNKENDKVIDPTYALSCNKDKDEYVYIIFKEFNNVEEYLKMLEKEETSLNFSLLKEQVKIQNELMDYKYPYPLDVIPISLEKLKGI